MINTGDLIAWSHGDSAQVIGFDSSNMGQKYEWYARRTEYGNEKEFPEEVKECGKAQDEYFLDTSQERFLLERVREDMLAKVINWKL